MQGMLRICDQFAVDYDMKFNVDKSVALRIGKRFANNCASVILSGNALKYVKDIKYLA